MYVCVCVCAFPPTKVRSVSVWPPRRTPARDTGARSKAFSSRSAALLYLCSTGGCRPGVPSAVLARVSTQEPGRSLAFEAAPLPPRGQRLDKTRNLTPRHLPLTEGLSSPAQGQDFPLHPGEGTPKERDPPVAGRRGQCGLGQGKFREALCANSGGACVPASEPCPANRLALLSPIPVFFPRLARLVASHLSEGGGGGLFSHSSTRFFYLVSILRESQFGRISEELRFGCVVPRHFGAFLGNENFRKVMNQLRF